MRKKPIEPSPGDLVWIQATDHTTCSDEGWVTPETIAADTPILMEIAGFFVCEANELYRVALLKAAKHFGTYVMVPKSTIKQLKILKRGKNGN